MVNKIKNDIKKRVTLRWTPRIKNGIEMGCNLNNMGYNLGNKI